MNLRNFELTCLVFGATCFGVHAEAAPASKEQALTTQAKAEAGLMQADIAYRLALSKVMSLIGPPRFPGPVPPASIPPPVAQLGASLDPAISRDGVGGWRRILSGP